MKELVLTPDPVGVMLELSRAILASREDELMVVESRSMLAR